MNALSLMSSVLALLLAQAAPSPPPAANSIIQGSVVDAETRKPVSNVVVTATSPNLQGERIAGTDAQGQYRIPRLPPGPYALRFEKEGFQPYSRPESQLRLDRTIRVNVELLPEGFVLPPEARPPTLDEGELPPEKVASVVVYPDRASVKRVKTVMCLGRTLAVFEALPPAADPSSFRARSEDATVQSLVATEHPVKGPYASELQTLRGQREALERELAGLRDTQARAQAQNALGEQLDEVAQTRVVREFAEPKPDTRAWTQAFDTALDVRLRARADLRTASLRLREVQRELDVLRAREDFLSRSAARVERRVEVRLACRIAGRAQVELGYTVGGAGWTPSYEARADEASGQVELSTFATVRQSTGEDWSGVRLALSTARTPDNASPPSLTPLWLTAQERERERKVLVRRDERQEHAEAAAAVPVQQEGSLPVASQGVSEQLRVPELVQVRGDGGDVRLRVARTKLKATFVWRAVPKLRPVVFRVARLVNSAPFALLPGSVDLFGGSGYIGRQGLERVPQGAPFQLTFGLEESLRVERVVVEEIARDRGLFNGKRRFRYAYRLDLANFRPGPEVLEVTEQLPVSELEDVKVELEEKTTAGHELDAADGFLTWKVKLAPAEKRSVDVAFHVDVPSSYDPGDL